MTDRRTGLRGLAAALAGVAVGAALGRPGPSAAKKKKPKGVAGTYFDYGDGVAYLNRPYGIAWRNTADPLIVTEDLDNLVTLVDPLSAGLGVAGGYPVGVAFVGSDIYVTDANLQRVYTRKGSDNSIKNPNLIGTGINGEAYIAGSGSVFYLLRKENAVLSRHQANGTQDWSVTTCSSPLGVAVGPGGNVYVTCYDNGGIEAYDPTTGAFKFRFGRPGDPGVNAKNQIERPYALAFDGDRGYVSTADFTKLTGTVRAFTYDVATSTYTSLGNLKPFAKKNDLTAGFAVDASSNVYMTKRMLGTVVRWTPAD